jgi:hypothetical protein
MNLASPSLVRYLIRADLPVSNSCECFTSGVTAYLASTSWLYDAETKKKKFIPQCELLDIAALPTQTAKDYAQRFVGALTVKDPHFGSVFSLAVVLAGAWRRMWPDRDPDDWLRGDWAAELGWYVAAEADGSGAGWSDDHPEHELQHPSIEASDEDFFVNEDTV